MTLVIETRKFLAALSGTAFAWSLAARLSPRSKKQVPDDDGNQRCRRRAHLLASPVREQIVGCKAIVRWSSDRNLRPQAD